MLTVIEFSNIDKNINNTFIYTTIYMLQRLKRTTKALFYGRNGISPNIDRYLNDHGDEFILEMIISWNVITSILTGSLEILSKQFREQSGNNLLYHLKMLIRTTYSNMSLKKNEDISISPYKMNYQAENIFVRSPPGLAINILLNNTRNKMGNSFSTYSAKGNNCQNFILAIALHSPFGTHIYSPLRLR